MWARVFLSSLLVLPVILGISTEEEEATSAFYQCVPGIGNNPGVSYPRGDIFRLAGSDDSVELYCHLNPAHSYFKKGYNSKDIFFEIKGKGKGQKIIMEKSEMETEIVNDTTIKTIFKTGQVAGIFDVRCKINIKYEDREINILTDLGEDRDGAEIVQRGVCDQKIHVGYPPLNVTDFKCISENWEDLNCTWTEPWNPARTNYDITFKEPGIRSPIKTCPPRSELERILMRKIPRDINQCYVNEKTHPQYRHPARKFSFLFNASNPLKVKGNLYFYKFDHFSIVRPGPAEMLSLAGESDTGLVLTYSVPNMMREFPPGLVQQIRVSNQHEPGEWEELDKIKDADKEDGTVQIKLNDQKLGNAYAWTNYTVEVKMRSATADIEASPDLWSSPRLVTGSTLARRPDSPPRMCRGCFEAVIHPEHRDIYVYWTKTEPRYHNGPNFEYVSWRLDSDVKTVEKKESSYAVYSNLSLSEIFSFNVTSRNDEGESAQPPYSLSVPAQDLIDRVSPQAVTIIYSESAEISVSWLRPQDLHASEEIGSYTVFWCERERFTDTFCQTILHFEDVHPLKKDLVSSSALTMAKDSSEDTLIYRLNTSHVSKDKEYRVAVAANYATMSSGMVWSSCEIVNNQMSSGWVREVSVERRGARWMELRWRLPCSQRSGLVLSYNLTWCDSEAGLCDSLEVRHSASLTNTHNITGLEPWRVYTITVTAVNMDPARVALPSPPLLQRTAASAPASKPLAFISRSVTNVTAEIAWSKPELGNGPVSHYKVSVHLASDNSFFTKPFIVDSSETLLTALTPYTDFVVRVVGCNKDELGLFACAGTEKAGSHSFRTDIGRPGRPKPPTTSASYNRSIYDLEWSTDFQVGGPASALEWELRITSEDGAHEKIEVPGEKNKYELDFAELDLDSDWVMTCDNGSVVPHYNVTIRAIITKQGELLTGPWSSVFSLQPLCNPGFDIGKTVALVVGLSVTFLSIIGLLFYSARYAKGKKDYFQKIGRELDDKYIPITRTENQRSDSSRTYHTTRFDGKPEKPGPDFVTDDQNDLMQTLLQRERSKDSETTSGCETGTSVDSSLQRQHSGSYSGGEADQEAGAAESPGEVKQEPAAAGQPAPNYVGYSKVVSAATNGLGHTNTSDSVSKAPPGYIQLPAACAAPPSSGYIQIQKVPQMLANCNARPCLPTSGPELVPSTDNPFYSRVSLQSPAQPMSDPGQSVKTTPGYIQLPGPAPGPLIISPNKLSEASPGPDSGPRPFEPHNTIV